MSRVVVVCLLLSNVLCWAQKMTLVDSLERELDSYPRADSHKVMLINKLANAYLRVNPERSELLSQQALNMAQTISYRGGEAWAWNGLGSSYLVRAQYDSALLSYEMALGIFKRQSNSREPLAKTRYNIGLVYFYQGKTIDALDYLIEAMNLYGSLNLHEEEANVVNAIASVYASQAQYHKALANYLIVLKLAETLGSDYLFNNVYHNLASIYFDLYESGAEKKTAWLDSALFFNRKALALRTKLGNRNGIAASLISLGNIYIALGKYGLALESFGSALKIKIELGDRRGQAICYENMAEVNSKLSQYGLAISLIQNAIKIYREIESPQDLLTAYRTASKVYQITGRYKEGFEIMQSYIDLTDSIFTKQKAAELAEMEAKYELARQAADNRLKDIEIQKERFWQQVYLYGISVALVLIVIMLILYINLQKNRKEALKANLELQQRNQEIASREEQVRLQAEILTQANEEITSTNDALLHSQKRLAVILKDFTSSMAYAKTIQAALLPTKELLYEIFPNSFVFIRPKAQVSGDLFWVSQHQNSKLIAAVDCTGHGVPGGFMSISAVFLLNQACRNVESLLPNLILRELHKNLRSSLRQDSAIIKDGMELSLCVWREDTKTLYFSGAGCNLIYIADGQLFEIKGERYGIGDPQSDGREFVLHQRQVDRPTVCYLFTDGYRDQFGGEKGRKFMIRRFKELLLDIHLLDSYDQSQVLERVFSDWVAGQHNQIDDVLVVGFKIE